MGRPSLFTQERLDLICGRLAQGIPLTVICREAKEGGDDDFPSPNTVRLWEREDTAVADAIARARADGEDAMAEQCLEIADDETHDWAMSKKGVVTDEVAIGRAKLRIDTRLKLLAKFNPKRWGDKVQHTGGDGGPIAMTILTAVPEPAGDGDNAG